MHISTLKLNIANKIYVVILAALTLATAYRILQYKSWDRYYYDVSASAPASFPVYIRTANLILADGDESWVRTNSVNDGNPYWGYGNFEDPDTKERLPEKLVLGYASFRDKSFYADTIPLPVEALKNALKNGYSEIIVGIANKGNIIIWMRNEEKELVLLKHQIKPHEPVGDDTYYERRLSKKEYFENVFRLDSASLEDFRKGVDKDANYIDTPSLFTQRLTN